MIQLTDFTKIYRTGLLRKKDTPAVINFSMSCMPGTITGLLGPNGAGKTTILKAVCAQHFATSGKVVVENIDASENPAAVRQCTGFVEEQSILPSEYTVAEYLHFCVMRFGFDKKQIENSMERIISECTISDVLSKKIGTLSKGYLQRVSFAKALAANPPVLVLDEPASGLDPAQIVRMRALIKNLSTGRTVLLSTHLMQEVDALCSNVYIVSHGTCAAHGTAESIIQNTKTASLEDAFLKLTSNDHNALTGDK
jgi:ABC-2 type transport system ATP-binding protein